MTSPAAQNAVVGHDTSQMTDEPFTSLLVQIGLGSPGSYVVSTSPALSVATHNDRGVQVRPASQWPGSSPVTCHVLGPATGSTDVSSCPLPLPATQTFELTHEITPVPPSPTAATSQAAATPAMGRLELRMLPA